MRIWTVSLPTALAPAVIVIHGVLVLAVQLHNGPDATTLTERDAPAAGALMFRRLSTKVQFFACCTVSVCPAIVNVPVLTLAGFARTVKPTVPFPLPIVPEVTVIQESLLAAVHVHPFTADTLTVGPIPPPGPAAWLVGVIE
jgi:hypothetical protein